MEFSQVHNVLDLKHKLLVALSRRLCGNDAVLETLAICEKKNYGLEIIDLVLSHIVILDFEFTNEQLDKYLLTRALERKAISIQLKHSKAQNDFICSTDFVQFGEQLKDLLQ